jgi:circadian clock protein KaiB
VKARAGSRTVSKIAKPKPKPKPKRATRLTVLRLYVAGSLASSTRAIQNARLLCDEHLAGRYSLEVIDILQQPALAKHDQILAVPTLIKKLPIPMRRFIGDLSNQDLVLVGLDLKPTR